MKKSITFNTKGYDGFIDFIKAYAIFMVVFAHFTPSIAMPGYPIWGGVQVPLFIVVQAFHVYKQVPKDINWKKVFSRVIIPFAVLQTLVWILLKYLPIINSDYLDAAMLNGWGGYGPGSYYPWIYVQMLIIIPLVRPILERNSPIVSGIIFVLLSAAIELACGLSHLSAFVYSRLFGRYFFLIYFGYIWSKYGIMLNAKNMMVSMFSLGALLFLAYGGSNNEPFFVNISTPYHRWPCYPYIALLLPYVLYYAYSIMRRSSVCKKVIFLLADCSYEIFLVQMMVCIFVRPSIFGIMQNKLIIFIFWYAAVISLSFVGGYCLRKMNKRIIYNHI